MSKKILVGVPKLDPSSLSEDVRDALKAHLADFEVEFVRMESDDVDVHDALCESMGIDRVVLVGPRPFPEKALERGVPHLVVTPDGKVRRLKELRPVWYDEDEV